MTTVTAFNMQEKLAEDYKQASEVSPRTGRTLMSQSTAADVCVCVCVCVLVKHLW